MTSRRRTQTLDRISSLPKPLLRHIFSRRRTHALDRFSSLPKPLLQHIFSFLDMKQAVQVSVLGRSWRSLWVSLTILNFDHSVWKKKGSKKRNQDKFMSFVERVLLLRSNSRIQRFTLSCGSLCDLSRVDTWIYAAVVKYEVEEIDLSISSGGVYELPHCMFKSSGTTRVSKLHVHFPFRDSRAKAPISMYSAIYLKTLHLVSVTLYPDDSSNMINLKCPVLESLILEDCEYKGINTTLNLSAPLLKNLVIGNGCNANGCCTLKISTPNLKSFKCAGEMFQDFILENLLELISADIDLNTWAVFFGVMTRHAWSLMKVFQGLHSINSLTLSKRSLQSLAKSPEIWDLGRHFHKLRHLKLTSSISRPPGSFVPPLAKLLMSFSGIETLHMDTNEVEDWGADFPSDCRFDRLKFVKIQYLRGSESELKFIEFILGSTTVLEKITIDTINTQKRDGEKKLVEFSERLQTFPRASSGAMILFTIKTGV